MPAERGAALCPAATAGTEAVPGLLPRAVQAQPWGSAGAAGPCPGLERGGLAGAGRRVPERQHGPGPVPLPSHGSRVPPAGGGSKARPRAAAPG